jgi:hypothetical protein
MRAIAAGIALAVLTAAPALARSPLVCIAPSDPADAGVSIANVESLEFYSDEGNPLLAYSVPFGRLRSAADAAGHIVNSYGIGKSKDAGATIVFAGATPLSFAIDELGRTYVSLARNDEETGFMSDAVPGIACYDVSLQAF